MRKMRLLYTNTELLYAQSSLHESRVDDAAIQLAEQLVDAKNKYSYNKANQRSTVRSRTDRAR